MNNEKISKLESLISLTMAQFKEDKKEFNFINTTISEIKSKVCNQLLNFQIELCESHLKKQHSEFEEFKSVALLPRGLRSCKFKRI